jgi:glyoxylase-like metal-dependent hydrolase (beta-lactamase superfamily II)
MPLTAVSTVAAILITVAWELATNFAVAAAMNMRVFELNDHLLCFYDGRPPPAERARGAHNWADYGALDVGVATYVIHSGNQALVYDTFPTAAEAQWTRDYLRKQGLSRFTVVNSHWHLDHVGGNAVYADAARIATDKTIEILTAKRAAIEAGTEWGPPAIEPLSVPNIGVAHDTDYYVGKIKVELRPVNIHSEDGLVIYLPADRILLAGDTLEDTVTFIAEPQHLMAHYRNLKKLKEWNVERIFPNHGDPDVISRGGYQTTLIDATLDYLRKVVMRSHDDGYLQGTLEDYVSDAVRKGWVSIWWAYREPHENNLKRVAEALRSQPLPELSD